MGKFPGLSEFGQMWYTIDRRKVVLLGVAQLVARDFWEVEVAGSSPVTQTNFYINRFFYRFAPVILR